MSTTTQILFHSPALKSLKREQLVKLCKRHGIRANGKNTDLIERLRQKATELPAEEIVWRDSDEEEDTDPLAEDSLMAEEPPRPSEQWEIVMDDIEEVDESLPGSMPGTLTSVRSVRAPGTPGEFGTAGSKGSVTSNLKAAIANSFGLKRAGLAKNDPLDIGTTRSLPVLPSQNDLAANDEPAVEPIPGAPSRPGMAAPTNARLSTGSSGGVTTTIRLISKPKTVIDTPPRLKPFSTTLDLDMGTPSAKRNVWPPTPSATLDSSRLYPAIPPEDLKPAYTSSLKSPAKMTPLKSTPAKGTPARATPGTTPLRYEMPSDAIVDIFSPAKPTSKPTPKPPAPSSADRSQPEVPAKPQPRLSVAQDDPFLFGSPLPRHSLTNTQFDNAAQDVLAEMNRRLAAAGVPAVAKTVLDKDGATPLPALPPKQAPSADRFAKTHEKAFGKMDSIANHYAARRPAAKPADRPTDAPAALGKRKSDAVAPPRAGPAKRPGHVAQTRVFSTGNRKKMVVPGGFGEENDGDDDEAEQAGDHRSAKRIRVTEGEDVHKGRRVSLLPNDGKTLEERAAEDKKREREKEALKKKIEARRKSRTSIGGKVAVPTKPQPARLGLFGAAKSLVGKVWNMGAGTSKPVAAAKPAASSRAAADKTAVAQKATASSLAKTVQPGTAHPRAPPKTDTVGSSKLARPPIPSFERPTGQPPAAPSTMPLQMRKTSNPKPPAGIGASSLGARTAPAAGPSNTTSMGSRRPTGMNIPTIRAPSEAADPKPSLPVRKRTISTLLAPTASSLAKRAGPTSSGAGPGRATPLASPGEGTLQQITNNSKTPRPLPAPPRTPVFGSPEAPSSPTAHLTADENQGMSLGAGAQALLASSGAKGEGGEGDGDGEDGAPLVPPKPRSLIARKPRISRTKVIARVGQQRTVSVASSVASTPRTRSSVGSTPRRSAGVAKNPRGPSGAGADIMMKKRVRQSEIARRKSNIGGVRPKKRESGSAMDVDG